MFGEGPASTGNKLIQLTWKSGKALVHELDYSESTRPTTRGHVNGLTYSGEGWGLTHFQNKLIMSNGSTKLQSLNPETMETESVVDVVLGKQTIRSINELENVNGLIYANIYGTGDILAIDPESGCVEKVYDINELWSAALSLVERTESQSDWDFVPNGIAYDQQTGTLYLTGKNWPLIFVFNHR